MNAPDLIGYAAATLTTVSFIPQALKVIRERDTKSLSLGMYTIFTIGVLLWGIYGYARRDWTIVASNSITALLCLGILAVKLRNEGLRSSPQRSNSVNR